MDPKNAFRNAWQPYLVAIVLIAAAAALRLWPLQALGARITWLTFYPAVVIAALYGGFSAGLLGTVLSCFSALFLLPVFVDQPFIRDSADWLGLAVFSVTCVMISFVAEAMRHAEARAKQAKEQIETANIKLREEITERKQAEERFRLAVEAAPNGMVMVNREGRIVLVNSQMERLFGYSREELMAQSIEFLVPERFRSKHPEHRAGFFGNPHTRAMGAGRDLYGLHKDGREIQIEIGLSLLTTAEGTFVLASIIDITERKLAEEAIKQLNARLELANNELEAFSYSVSHDLRAPLRSIDGFSQALLEDYADRLDTEGKVFLKRVRAATQRMAQLIDDLLNLARVTRSEMRRERVDLSALAEAIAAELRKMQPERDAAFIIAHGLVVEGDAQLLRIMLENLLGNAWKFTRKHPRARIEFGLTHQDGKPAYYVRDDGAGFEMAYADKLFTAFQRLHGLSEFEGTGIGLGTVRRIVQRHGGRIWAEGEVEKGATFYFIL